MNCKRIIFNQIIDNQEQLNEVRFFLRMVEKHLGKIKERKFRLIIEEVEKEPVDPGKNPMERFKDT